MSWSKWFQEAKSIGIRASLNQLVEINPKSWSRFTDLIGYKNGSTLIHDVWPHMVRGAHAFRSVTRWMSIVVPCIILIKNAGIREWLLMCCPPMFKYKCWKRKKNGIHPNGARHTLKINPSPCGCLAGPDIYLDTVYINKWRISYL